MFSEIPVVVGAYISKVTGAPVDVSAKLWVQGVSAKVEEQGGAAAAVATEEGKAEAGVMTSLLSVEAMVDD